MPNETTTDPYVIAAEALQTIIETEFAAEGFTAQHDQLHDSLGTERVEIGIAPAAEYRMTDNAVVNIFAIEIRFYDVWDKEIDPEQTVDPRRITGFSNRLKRAIQQSQATFPGGGSGIPEVWYFDWVRTDYPNDPTGNKSRFHMRVEARGDNTALIETR